jgi:hypothetical protein
MEHNMQFGFSSPVVALLAALPATAGVLIVFFPKEVRAFLQRLDSKPTKEIQKESAAKLAEMDRNVAERKASSNR